MAIINKGNIHDLSHNGKDVLVVTFMGNGAKYSYQPFSVSEFDQLIIASGDDDKEVFKKHFKENVKDNKKLNYKKL